jgi:RNA polymerase sigma-70 factor (ECF subfamily)
VRETRVIPLMSAFATLGRVYSMSAAGCGAGQLNDITDRTQSLGRFLASVELRAYRIARASLRHDEDALDAVQDAMLQLARAYATRPAEEWKPLFYRILDNRVRDLQRRRSVRARFLAWLPARSADPEDDHEHDPIAQAVSPEAEPARVLEGDEAMQALDRALADLPHRQRQAFLLRCLEGLDVAQTAAAMGCSHGSVKTHYFRALQTLRERLGDFVR